MSELKRCKDWVCPNGHYLHTPWEDDVVPNKPCKRCGSTAWNRRWGKPFPYCYCKDGYMCRSCRLM